jgi:hypothetical protein
MPHDRRTFAKNNSHETPVVQFSRSPSTPDPGSRAAKISRKLEQKAHPVLTSGADPGPAGFDWEELISTAEES